MNKNKYKNKSRIRQGGPTADGFSNFTMGLGVNSEIDNAVSQGFFAFNDYTKNRIQLEAAYRTNWLCSSLVSCVAEDMTRAGLDFTGEIEPTKLVEFQTFWKYAGIMDDFTDGLKWGRLYGGAVGLIMIRGADYTKPLDVTKVRQNDFIGFPVFDRWRVTPDLNNLIQSGRDIGLPEYYTFTEFGLELAKVHHSYIIRFTGDKLPHYQAINELLWGASILENVIDRIMEFETATAGVINLVSRAHLRTVKVEDLRETLARGGQAEANLIKSFQYIRKMQNNEGITLLDKVDEFQAQSFTFSGLTDITTQHIQQIAGAKRIPLPVLFGESPAGLNASGDSDIRIYYDGIAAAQGKYYEHITKLAHILYQSKFGEDAPEDLGIKWRSLWQHTEQEKADITAKTVTSIIALHESGLIDKTLALKELKQASELTNFGTNITADDINNDNPPDYTPEAPTSSTTPTKDSKSFLSWFK